MQPRIRTHDVDTDHGDCEERAAPGSPRGPRHGVAGGDDGPRMPATIPITLAAMTYGRHAADEGWGDLRAGRRPREAASGGQPPTWRDTWDHVHDLALRLGARMRGGVG